ncbi:MAG TPA: zf-HC2 domain-containing protein [Mycobacteriales bacterium]|nr:zf-HC2 domain-containing protein [Mycobacteriales bacterium]
MRELLVEYAAGTLDPAQRGEVEAHLAACADCSAELAGWAGLAAAATREPAEPPPGPELVYRVMVRSALSEPAPADRPPTRLSLALVVAEARLLRLPVLVASALVMALAVAMVATRTAAADGWAGDVLAMVAPVVAAIGISGVYGPQRDPAFEVVAATPTTVRLILLVRIALVFGYDLALALAASGAVTVAGADAAGIPALVVAWLGPMALLSALCVLLVVWVGPDIAIGVALALWSLRVLAGSSVFADVTGLVDFFRAVWSTNPATGSATAALLLTAVVLAGRGEPVRHVRATHPV